VVVLPPKATAAAAPAADAAGAGRCTTIGPFRELSQAATAAAALRTAGFEPEQRVAEGDIWIGYWVYIQAIPTLDEANAILAKVREIGITDSYVIPNSDSGNLVSLGVFSEISGVSRRRDQVRGLGFEPHVVDRTRRATVYWVDVTLHGDQTIDFESLQPPGRIMRLEQKPCESVPG
jgi:cell division septation protein DedD